jgi:hypothetical protein
MGQVLHGCATTTEAVRRGIQHSQESLRALSKRHGINQKTVAKWKKCSTTGDLPTGPKDPKSTKRKFKSYPIGYFHIAEVRTAEGRLFVATDRTSKFASEQKPKGTDTSMRTRHETKHWRPKHWMPAGALQSFP